MELETIKIPRTSSDIIESYRNYYKSFELDLLHVSNKNFTNYINQYLGMLLNLCKHPGNSNQIRAAIGILSLHRFGYHNFQSLVQLFDRIIPQMDFEYIKFTSWVAGQLINHPDIEESRYVTHLLTRIFEWTKAIGRRARPLHAVELLASLSTNAGNYVVTFFPSLQIIIWSLVSHPSLQVLKTTASAISAYLKAIMRYGRAELENIMAFFVELCLKLLSFEDPIKEYAALLLLEVLVNDNPSFFINENVHIIKIIFEDFYDSSILVQSQTYVTLACFSQVDSQYFIEMIADEMLEITESLITEFPNEISKSLCLLCKTIPEFVEQHLQMYTEFAKMIIEDEPDSAFLILSAVVENFHEKIFPLDFEFINKKINHFYINFMVELLKLNTTEQNEINEKLCLKLIEELKSNDKYYATILISKMSLKSFTSATALLPLLWDLTNDENEKIRKVIPNAIFNIARQNTDSITIVETSKNLLQIAMFEQKIDVRRSIIKALSANVVEELAGQEFLDFYKIFLEDENFIVRKLTIKFLAKIMEFNPMPLNSMIRETILNNFFIIRHVPQIQKRATAMRLLPYLIKASAMTIKAYSKGIMDIVTKSLEEAAKKQQYENFLEEDAQVSIIISIIKTLTLLAPLDPKVVSHNSEFIIPKICGIAMTTEHRKISLSIFHLLYVLLTPPASTLVIRAQVPIILSYCTEYLKKTHSRKAKISILKVLGAIGVPEVHQRQLSKGTQTPANINDQLARLFFQPSRDSEPENVDDSILLNRNASEQYFSCFTAASLMKILCEDSMKAYYEETIHALVKVLSKPKMWILSYYDNFIDRLLVILEDSTNDEINEYMKHFTYLVSNSMQNVSPFVKRSLSFITKHFCDTLASSFLDLIIAFLESIRDGFSPYASDTICLLVGCLEEKRASDTLICKKVLRAFTLISVYATDLLYMIIPQVSETIISKMTLTDVKIAALRTLISLINTIDIKNFFGPISRVLSYCITSDKKSIFKVGYTLLNNVLVSHGQAFLNYSDPLFRMMKQKNLITPDLKRLIDAIAQGNRIVLSASIDSMASQNQNLNPETKRIPFFSEEAIIARAQSSVIGVGHQLEQWLYSFMLSIISNSPSPAIRSCYILATSYYPLAAKLFNAAFLSCWSAISETGKEQLKNFFSSILFSSENYDSVANELLELVIFMDKIEQPFDLPIPELIKSSIKYGKYQYALKLQQEILYKSPNNVIHISSLIDILIQLGQWDDASGLWRKSQTKSATLNRSEVLAHLKIWDQAEIAFAEQYKKSHNFNSLMGLAESLVNLSKWSELFDLFDEFTSLEIGQKRQISPFFAEAALHLNKWNQLEQVLQHSPNDSVRCQILHALLLLHKKDYEALSSLINNTFSLIASRPIAYWAENQLTHRDIVLLCEELVEVNEMKSWLTEPKQRDIIEEIWNERLKTMPRDFDLWMSLTQNRVRVANARSDSLIQLFQLKSISLGTKNHVNSFDILFPNFTNNQAPDMIKMCRAITEWNTGNKIVALKQMMLLTTSREASFQANYFYANWLIETKPISIETFKKAYVHLSHSVSLIDDKTIKKFHDCEKPMFVKSCKLVFPSQIYKELVMHNSQIEMLRKWSQINSSLVCFEPDNRAKYAINAISALSRCASLSPSFPDVVNLLNLFFENSDNEIIFDQTKNYVKNISVKLLLQASPQIIVQLSHSELYVRNFVQNLVFELLLDHYHCLVFSLIVTSYSKNQTRANSARSILEKLKMKSPSISDEVKLIRNALLRAAVTWSESILQNISDIFEYFQRKMTDKILETLRSIITLVSKPRCEMHDNFLQQYSKNITILQQILKIYTPGNVTSLSQISQWCKNMQDSLTDDLKRIKTIQLASISEELGKKTDFKLAVFGSYKPNKPVNHIKYFVGQFSVYMSKQQPKDVVVKGEDGVFYQYLLKGHEDLRLDERIQQFFRLINSILLKETKFNSSTIQTVAVIPLSMSHGLVQWATGTDTLRTIIENYRRLHRLDPMMEYVLADDLSNTNYDYLEPIQKMQILETISNQCPDDDLAGFFWLKTQNAETWLKHSQTFSISASMMSIVGYVIGLGDRHPSNLLIDRTSGKIVHIDFGDCFEKAQRRKYLPEVVPFRLTRQIVKALGAGGVDGSFKSSFISMSHVLRNNRQVLETVLAIFVHEPLSNTDDFSIDLDNSNDELANSFRAMKSDEKKNISSPAQMRHRINQKLTGEDFTPGKFLSVENQATLLIKNAIDPYNLSKMYSGWCPFW